MGRRSDHSRAELEALILHHGQQLLAQSGYARFSAREVAKRIGYSVGTIFHIHGNVDGLVMAINSRTFTQWARALEDALARADGRGRIDCLVDGYFDFAAAHPQLWSAIYEHRLPAGTALPEALERERAGLTAIIDREVATLLPHLPPEALARLARSLIATVHGHCSLMLAGSFALMGEQDPARLARERVREILAAHGGPQSIVCAGSGSRS